MMNGEDKQFFDIKLGALEKLMEQKWKAHDTHSTERWGEIKDAIDGIEDKMRCDVHVERMKGMDGQIKAVWTFVTLIIGSIVGGFYWLIRK